MNAIPGISSTTAFRVRFVDSDDNGMTTMEIELPLDEELIGEVYRELNALGIEIASVQVRTSGQRLTGLLKLREPGRSSLSQRRRLGLQDRVFGLLQQRLVVPRSEVRVPLPAAAG